MQHPGKHDGGNHRWGTDCYSKTVEEAHLGCLRVGSEIIPPYYLGQNGGPGGWIIIIGPEIGLEEHTLVPDLAGWRKERFPIEEDHNWISAAPDWVCEILSPNTFRTDKIKKMPIYARHDVSHIWLVDPIAMTMDAFRLESADGFYWGVFLKTTRCG